MSTHCVSMIKNFNLSSKIKEEEAISMEKQGIVSILDNVDSSSSSTGEEDHHEELKDQPIITFDWSSILSSKNEDSTNKLISTSPYVHPLDKKSKSSLSERSLEICTESLGSESSSDCFSSSPKSDTEDSNNDKDYHCQEQQKQQNSFEDFGVVKYNYSKRLISSPKSFPPSLPSVHMQSRRQNGRLILEAASVPSNNLHAQRVHGHLLLTFINQNDSKLEMENYDDEPDVFERVFDDMQEVEGNETPHSDSGGNNEEEEEEGEGVVMEQSPRMSSEVTNVKTSAPMMLEKKNPLTWSRCTVSFSMTSGYFNLNSRFNCSVNSMTEEEKYTSNIRECYTYPSSVSQSLPLPPGVAEVIPAPPPPAAAASLNAYENFWRKKPTVANIVNNSTVAEQRNKDMYYNNNKQDLVLIRGNKASMNNNLVPLLRSCKEPRRSLIIWEPYCIATS
ncbi:protein FAF-like, chloroplastic [Lycium ferocissimum]|uniref:protein FAF-like, chloroplastic n=1 Tax=Lycium ferocissimum TaxID=112874 RepID=UPI0028150335|nr:protein FAF-like, chloroplastic [Lycium ferocissimum]